MPKQNPLNYFAWVLGFIFVFFVCIPYLIRASSKRFTPDEQVPVSKKLPVSQCSLIDGYQIGMSIQNFKDAYPKSLPAPSCRTRSPKMVRCDGQMDINNIKTSVSFDFGYGNDYKDEAQFAFGNGKLFGVKGGFEISELNALKQAFLKKFGVPMSDKKESTGYEGMSWNKDGNAIMLSQIPDGEGYLFSIIPLDPKRLSVCLSAH